MKDGDRFLELVRRRNAVKTLWSLFSSPLHKRDAFHWLDFLRVNKN